jgi:chromosome partitioning protein
MGDLIPSNDQLANADLILRKRGDEYTLKKAIEPIRNQYDFIVIDCPPSLGILTMNAITAADYVIIPAQADGYSLIGINELAQTIRDVNPDVKVAGILLTMFNGRTRIAQEVSELLDQLAEKLNTKVFDTKIRASVKASEIQFHPIGLFKYAPKATITQDYAAWIDELLESL